MTAHTTPTHVQKPTHAKAAAGRATRNYLASVAGLTAAFAWPLYELARFSLSDDAYSHILLVPFVSGYLVWIRRRELRPSAAPDPRAALVPAALAIALLAGLAVRLLAGEGVPARADRLALTTAAFVALFIALTTLFLGRGVLRTAAFPAGFLVFMIPTPTWLMTGIETMLQHSSATAAHWMFMAVGTPVVRYDLVFQLPGVLFQVAPECSGIRSTTALFITSVVAGYLFLRSPWARVALAIAVAPLAVLRNGFRVFTLGELCVEISPDMMNSFIHHQGGPIFFALSLIPFGLFLWLLIRLDRRSPAAVSAPAAPLSTKPTVAS